ncbi:hypothetical protein BV25DRAFT_1834775 [Artomyces pyxidatus]|uniref:Uncharacterized protein n=1 Tax=Artomyces pyxidatus TaxID=48021 RepID=A0ACB8TH38_9AGAM|nr:hypothetical protein BV25DRAFT_1834775 [Artomyces pyxidatus]
MASTRAATKRKAATGGPAELAPDMTAPLDSLGHVEHKTSPTKQSKQKATLAKKLKLAEKKQLDKERWIAEAAATKSLEDSGVGSDREHLTDVNLPTLAGPRLSKTRALELKVWEGATNKRGTSRKRAGSESNSAAHLAQPKKARKGTGSFSQQNLPPSVATPNNDPAILLADRAQQLGSVYELAHDGDAENDHHDGGDPWHSAASDSESQAAHPLDPGAEVATQVLSVDLNTKGKGKTRGPGDLGTLFDSEDPPSSCQVPSTRRSTRRHGSSHQAPLPELGDGPGPEPSYSQQAEDHDRELEDAVSGSDEEDEDDLEYDGTAEPDEDFEGTASSSTESGSGFEQEKVEDRTVTQPQTQYKRRLRSEQLDSMNLDANLDLDNEVTKQQLEEARLQERERRRVERQEQRRKEKVIGKMTMGIPSFVERPRAASQRQIDNPELDGTAVDDDEGDELDDEHHFPPRPSLQSTHLPITSSSNPKSRQAAAKRPHLQQGDSGSVVPEPHAPQQGRRAATARPSSSTKQYRIDFMDADLDGAHLGVVPAPSQRQPAALQIGTVKTPKPPRAAQRSDKIKKVGQDGDSKTGPAQLDHIRLKNPHTQATTTPRQKEGRPSQHESRGSVVAPIRHQSVIVMPATQQSRLGERSTHRKGSQGVPSAASHALARSESPGGSEDGVSTAQGPPMSESPPPAPDPTAGLYSDDDGNDEHHTPGSHGLKAEADDGGEPLIADSHVVTPTGTWPMWTQLKTLPGQDDAMKNLAHQPKQIRALVTEINMRQMPRYLMWVNPYALGVQRNRMFHDAIVDAALALGSGFDPVVHRMGVDVPFAELLYTQPNKRMSHTRTNIMTATRRVVDRAYGLEAFTTPDKLALAVKNLLEDNVFIFPGKFNKDGKWLFNPKEPMCSEGIIKAAREAFFGPQAAYEFPPASYVSSIASGEGSDEPELPGPMVGFIATTVGTSLVERLAGIAGVPPFTSKSAINMYNDHMKTIAGWSPEGYHIIMAYLHEMARQFLTYDEYFPKASVIRSIVHPERRYGSLMELAEEHVAGTSGEAGPEGGAQWKDIGIWSEKEWTMLIGKALGSMTKMMVYSMAVDGPVRVDTSSRGESKFSVRHEGYLAGSKAMESLDRFITSTESFFHPSNSGIWTLSLTNFLNSLTSEFCKRWYEEEQISCKTPITHRLTPAIRRAFVSTLRTPALLAMFSKDPLSMGYAQAALKTLAFTEPALIMPDLLDRAYSGLEVVNETHRTTAVMSMLSSVVQPLASEKIWLGGQKHIVPLLELCIPGIDLNDPVKTICATMFIASVMQNIKIGDLSSTASGLSLSDDTPSEEVMDVDDETPLPHGTEIGYAPALSRDEERMLVRESTASFADWVTSFFRRVLALYENLPEEGGKKNTTGGKQEEQVLKSLKGTLDVVCLHLSDSLFDLVLRLVYDYATTNAKSNAVKAFGQLVASLARAQPTKTINRFLPFCLSQIKDELRHGASSIRTTSSHQAVPSDTTLHWNLSILRGCFGCEGTSLLKHKSEIIELLTILVDKTLSERGYNETGRLITRILATLSGVYPVNIPSTEEIDLVLDILDNIVSPALDRVHTLLPSASTWDNVARNDFCRRLHVVKSAWAGLTTLLKESPKQVVQSGLNPNTEVERLVVTSIHVLAGFALVDPLDPRYSKAAVHRRRFGDVLHLAALALGQDHQGEDHIDAVLLVAKGIDVYLLDYAISRGDFDSLQKNYSQARSLNRAWPKQKEKSRLVYMKRAQVYHSGRVYMHALYRRRSELDDHLLVDLLELSLSPYTRVRRHAQSVLHNASGYYVRSTKLILPRLYDALTKGTDPDRMKGALYILWNKGIDPKDPTLYGRYLLALLDCQHEEKPSIQKLVTSLSQEAVSNLNEETTRTDAYVDNTPGVDATLDALKGEFTAALIDEDLLQEAKTKGRARVLARQERYQFTIDSIVEIAKKPTTHSLAQGYHSFGRRCNAIHRTYDEPAPVSLRGIVKLCGFIKVHTYSKSSNDMWLDEWSSPFSKKITLKSIKEFHEYIKQPIDASDSLYVDKVSSGFLSWGPHTKAYISTSPLIAWADDCQPALEAISAVISRSDYYTKLTALWGQESGRNTSTPQIRTENVTFIKTLAKMFHGAELDTLLATTDPLLLDSDRFKQRAGAEVIAGLSRGSKHWQKHIADQLWSWIITRLDKIYAQIKPDTIGFWEAMVNAQLDNRDPRRCPALISWILALPLDLQGDSAFAMTKSLTILGCFLEYVGFRDTNLLDQYFDMFMENINIGFAEMRVSIATNLYFIITNRWRPSYPSVEAFLQACEAIEDPLCIRTSAYTSRVADYTGRFPSWKEERLPPPRVNQSEQRAQYDKVGLTRILRWMWISFYSPQAPLMFPFIMPLLKRLIPFRPEFFRMSELSDNPELQAHSQAVLYILSAVAPPPESIEAITATFVEAIKSSVSWRIRLNAIPTLVVFFYRNLLGVSDAAVSSIMDLLLDCLSDDNVEVREMASKALSGIVRVSQRQSIVPLKDHFVCLSRKVKLPARREPGYAEALRTLHSAILGLCALIESFPYSVEKWVPPLTDVLALHATDPPPISTTIRKSTSEFKKTHQDTWHKDQLAFDEDQLQNLSTMLVGTSYFRGLALESVFV